MEFSKSKQDFVQTVTPFAQKASTLLGGKIPYQAIVSQWAHESGYGGYTARNSWVGVNNLAGVNVPSGNTPVRQGKNAFASLDEFVTGYVNAIGINNDRSTYVKAGLREATDISTFASALAKGGYAGNPNYNKSLVNTYNEIYGANTTAGNTTTPPQTEENEAGGTKAETTTNNPLDIWGNIKQDFSTFWGNFAKVIVYGLLLFVVVWLMFKITNSKELTG